MILIAVLLTVFGLTASIALVQLTGLRLSGVVVVPLLALYTLVAISALPVFLVSVTVAIAAVGFIRQRTLIHGRALFLASLAAGAVVPAAGTLAMSVLSLPVELTFLGTILPGVTAYNYFRLEGGQRLHDLAASVGVFAALVVVGVLLVVSPVDTSVLSVTGLHGLTELAPLTAVAPDAGVDAGGVE